MENLRPFAFALALGCGPASSPASDGVRAAAPLRINGSTTVNLVAARAAEILRAEQGLTILVDTQGGSSGGIALLAEGQVEIGMSSKPISATDRAKFPGVDFVAHPVGQDAVALVVSADVWEAGVRTLSRAQMRAIYEGRIVNWSAVGGADQRIAFLNKEPGRGTFEVFAKWLYGSVVETPEVSFPEVGGNEETRNKVARTPGALSQLSCSWADGERVFALALESDAGSVEPTPANIASGRYPMSRPLFLLTDGPPRGAAKEFVEFVRSPAGQQLVREQGYLGLAELGGGP